MKRTQAVKLVEELLNRLAANGEDFPASLINEVYLFGSFARGALDPHDLDVDIEYDQTSERWRSYFIGKMTRGENPFTTLLQAVRGNRRLVQVQLNQREDADFPMTLLWRRGEDFMDAFERLYAIQPDPDAGRAERHAMLPQFEGLDQWIPRPTRELLEEAVNRQALGLERIDLADAQITDAEVQDFLHSRWKKTSPLYRAGSAVLGHYLARASSPKPSTFTVPISGMTTPPPRTSRDSA